MKKNKRQYRGRDPHKVAKQTEAKEDEKEYQDWLSTQQER